MILASHILVGAAVATSFVNPISGVFFAFLSHFVLDRIPHWEYSVDPLKQIKTRGVRYCLPILRRVFLDFALGYALLTLAIALATQRIAWDTALFGGFSGILPDGMTFLLFLWRGKKGVISTVLKLHYILHVNMHFSKEKGLPPLHVGLSTQGIAILLALYFLIF